MISGYADDHIKIAKQYCSNEITNLNIKVTGVSSREEAAEEIIKRFNNNNKYDLVITNLNINNPLDGVNILHTSWSYGTPALITYERGTEAHVANIVNKFIAKKKISNEEVNNKSLEPIIKAISKIYLRTEIYDIPTNKNKLLLGPRYTSLYQKNDFKFWQGLLEYAIAYIKEVKEYKNEDDYKKLFSPKILPLDEKSKVILDKYKEDFNIYKIMFK